MPTGQHAQPPKYHVSIVHDFFVQWGGAELVVDALNQAFPNNTLYASIDYPRIRHKPLDRKEIETTFIQRLPFVKTKFREIYKFLLPIAFAKLKFPAKTKLIVSDTASFAKFIVPPVGVKHISYIHTPPRFLWGLPPSKKVRSNAFLRFWWNVLFGTSFRIADFLHARRTHALIANSKAVERRINKFYRRNVKAVVNPPVYVKKSKIDLANQDIKITKSFLAFGRLELYKNFHTVAKLWPKGYKLTISGTGSLEEKIKRLANENPDITFINRYIPDEEKIPMFAAHSGFLYPNVEDFGIMMVEAIAVGTPAISFKQGGGGEIISHRENGYLIEDLNKEQLKSALDWCLSVERSEKQKELYYKSMLKYDISAFIQNMRDIATEYVKDEKNN